jgi:hypothetical protein
MPAGARPRISDGNTIRAEELFKQREESVRDSWITPARYAGSV